MMLNWQVPEISRLKTEILSIFSMLVPLDHSALDRVILCATHFKSESAPGAEFSPLWKFFRSDKVL